MSTYFHGWRRKAGCATLAMAVVFTVGWVRSLFVEDFLGNSWFSRNGAIERVLYHSSARLLVVNVDEKGNEISSTEVDGPTRSKQSPNTISNQPLGFVTEWRIPYWPFVLPLTVLSAYLLLGKPATKKPG